jgi:hypothetical protein
MNPRPGTPLAPPGEGTDAAVAKALRLPEGPYSTEFALAWGILERAATYRLASNSYLRCHEAEFRPRRSGKFGVGFGVTPALAICGAVLDWERRRREKG